MTRSMSSLLTRSCRRRGRILQKNLSEDAKCPSCGRAGGGVLTKMLVKTMLMKTLVMKYRRRGSRREVDRRLEASLLDDVYRCLVVEEVSQEYASRTTPACLVVV